MLEYKKIFLTVGTTRFDLLCRCIKKSSTLGALKKLGCNQIIAQIGNSDVEPGDFVIEGVRLILYRFKDSLENDIQEADLIISHAGAGSCLEALQANKPLLVVVNEDLMDNHQLELAEQLQIDGNLYYCTCDTLVSTLEEVDFSLLVPFSKPNITQFMRYLNSAFQLQTGN